MVNTLDSGVVGVVLSPARVTVLSSWVNQYTLRLPVTLPQSQLAPSWLGPNQKSISPHIHAKVWEIHSVFLLLVWG